jgi:hypothetical protein
MRRPFAAVGTAFDAVVIAAKRWPRSHRFDDFVGLASEAVARDGVEIGAGGMLSPRHS